MFRYLLIAAAVIGADQTSKYFVRLMMSPGDRIPIYGRFFGFEYVTNTGTAFSMFEGNKMVTVVLTSLLILVCIIFIITEARRGSKGTATCLTVIAAGGLSNLYDRLTVGYVTDMISVWRFAVFNVADIAVTCGCAVLVLLLLLESRSAMLQ